jgi:hypothetical protein
MRFRLLGTILCVSALCAPGWGQIHRPYETLDSGSTLDALPFVDLSNSDSLRAHIDPSTAEGRRAARYDTPSAQPLYRPKEEHRPPFRTAGELRPDVPIELKADVIATGTIVSESAHLTKSGSEIYSTFRFHPDKVLKGIRGALPPSMDLERGGGVALYPSGKKFLIGTMGWGIPEPHYRYLLFLSRTSDGSYAIITGYLLDGTRVMPFDRISDAMCEINSASVDTDRLMADLTSRIKSQR